MEIAMNNIILYIYYVSIGRYRLLSFPTLTFDIILFLYSKHSKTENTYLLFIAYWQLKSKYLSKIAHWILEVSHHQYQ